MHASPARGTSVKTLLYYIYEYITVCIQRMHHTFFERCETPQQLSLCTAIDSCEGSITFIMVYCCCCGTKFENENATCPSYIYLPPSKKGRCKNHKSMYVMLATTQLAQKISGHSNRGILLIHGGGRRSSAFLAVRVYPGTHSSAVRL